MIRLGTSNNDVTYKLASMAELTLIELHISILLGSVLRLAISGVYLESVRNFTVENEMARLQENGRFSLNLMRREISQAGFFAGHQFPLPLTDIEAKIVHRMQCGGSG